jgi:para-nitrobenzyl esterase
MTKPFSVILIAAAFLAVGPAIRAQHVNKADTVRIEGGTLSGLVLDGVRAYRGIPYAAAPVGTLRWKPPQPAAAWTSTQAADEVGPACPQTAHAPGSIFPDPTERQSEDCLNLNVWTPARGAERLPVMVWFHGGGWRYGSGTSYVPNGAPIAKKGVVLVTVNYRLGALGFLAHPALSAESARGSSGNYGFLDQIAALQWVQRNIAAFGGDPNRVTIIGESAGSWTVSVLIASPLSRGLLHRGIGESGGRFNRQPYLRDARNGLPAAETTGLEFAKAAGAQSLDQLRAISVEKILTLQFRAAENVDGWVLPDQIRELYAQRRQAMVPVLVGSNLNETTPDPAHAPKTVAEYRDRLAKDYGELSAEFERVYPAASDADIAGALAAITGHNTFTVHMRTWARMTAAAGQKAFLYHFTHAAPHPETTGRLLGAFHTSEVPYVFNHIRQHDWKFTDVDVRLADAMSSYWVNFATAGDPNGKGLPRWEPYDMTNEPYMELGDTLRPGRHLLKAQLDVLDRFDATRRSTER